MVWINGGKVSSVLKEIMGLPGHILVVHAAVVFVPLLALLATVYGVSPRWRSRLGWAVIAFAVASPVAVFAAAESGEELAEVLTEKGYPPQVLSQVETHAEYGERLLWFTVALAVAAVALPVATSGHRRARNLPSWFVPVLTAVTILSAVGATVYVYLTGESGAQAVWQGVL